MAARRGSGTSLNSHHQDTLAESRRDSNVFSDDYAESIAGSFADSEDAVSVGRSASVRSIGIHNIDGAEDPFRDTAARSAGAVMWQGQHHIGQPSRSSTRKSLRGPGAQEVDQSHGLGFGHGTNNGIAPARIATHRTASTASSASYAQPTSPVSLAHGPSHPYGMYPQGISVSRSESVASTTTGRTRSQLYHGRPRPAHPYALYSQNVADPTPDVQQSIPVGFPGQHTNSFHRNIGPEGEEQDIIGPDGHMEQLPPYSRYPEQEHSKLAGATPQPSIVADADQSVPQSDPSIETSDPPDGPEEDDTSESAPLNRQPGDASGFGYGPPSEKSWDEKTWRERKNHRVGCLPLWGFTALMVGLVMCGTIIGAAIGEAVGRHSSTATNSNNSTSTSTMTQTSNYPKEGKTPFGSAPMVTETVTATTTMIDASPIPTISAIPSFSTVLPTGKYAVSFGEASMAGNGCLVNSLQINAWSCQLTPSAVTLLVTPGDKPGRYNASISPFGPTTVYTYGEQPPQVLPQPIKPALDQGIPQNYGLAYQFQTTYEKVVIIDEEALSPSRKNRMKRGGQFWRQVHRGTVNNNDKPWFCHFPNTFIEGFIYVQNDTDPSAASSTTTTTTTTSDSSGTETRTITVVPSGSTYMPTSIATSWSGTDNAYPSSMSFIQHQRQSGGPPPPPPPPPPPSPSSPPPPPPPPSWKKRGLERRQSTNNQLSRYPRRVKLIERRLRTVDGAMPGYCVKMQYQGGDWVPICDGNGNQMMIPLAEDDPPAPAPSAPQSPALSRRNFGNNECYCQWLSN